MKIKKLTQYDHDDQAGLTRALAEASRKYYAGEDSGMSDREFDESVSRLRQMEAKSGYAYEESPTVKVGAPTKGLRKSRHEHPALSLDKVKYGDREKLRPWLGGRQAVISWKCDGLTLVLTYDGGRLAKAVTRGDGEEGGDVTHNARFFEGIPAEIPYKGHLVARGEAMMTYAEFERVNAEANGTYENPRNLAAATIQMLDAEESRKRGIIFRAFELVTPEPVTGQFVPDPKSAFPADGFNLQYMQDRLDWLQVMGFDVVDRECCDASDILQKIEEWKEDVQNLAFPTDGLVISYQNLVEGWALGSTGHHPRWAMALKWTDETYTTTIRDIEWSVGKTGIITPIAVFDEVRMGLGSNVTRASLHNLSILSSLAGGTYPMDGESYVDIGNCKAEVYMANLIIPQVSAIYKGTPGWKYIPIPQKCPVCGANLKTIDSNGIKTLHCINHEGCPAQQVGKLMNTFSKDGLFVKGLGESQIEDLIEYGIVDASPLSFYRATTAFSNGKEFSDKVVRLLEKDGWGKKKWENLVDAINASRNTTLQKFLYSLNIPLLGNDMSKKLAKYFHNSIGEFVKFVERVNEGAGGDDRYGYHRAMDILTAIDGVGEEKARNIVDWAEEVTAYREKWEDFMSFVKELNFPEPTSGSADSSLEGLTFVITGSVHQYKNRDEFKASVEARGGKVAGAVSKNTTALVMNPDAAGTSSKALKARKIGLEVLSEEEFIARYGK